MGPSDPPFPSEKKTPKLAHWPAHAHLLALHPEPSALDTPTTAVDQSPSHVRLFSTPWPAARQVSLSLAISWSLSKFVLIQSGMPPNSVTLFSFCLQSFPASGSSSMHRFFFHTRWPKYWSFSFSSSPSNEYSGLISFRID